jgi:hypothetical protein
MLIILFEIMGIVHKEFVLSNQTICEYYCHVLRRLLKNVRRLRHELWRQKEMAVAIRLEGRHFDTIEAIEAEPQAVLNSVT